MNKYETVDEYISSFNNQNYNPEIYKKLNELKEIISKELQNTNLVISYGIPTFKSTTKPYKNLIHFGGYKKHISVYPGPKVIEYFEQDLANFKLSKGTIQFELNKELPVELINKLLNFIKFKNNVSI